MLSRKHAELRIGCSGWQYRHWRGAVYPADLPQAQWFDAYARTFDTVEINNSFYRLPPPETFARWRTQAPPGFLYAIKASRYLTHMKKLKDPEEPLARFFGHARELRSACGAVLYQLPPHFGRDLDRLERFVEAIPPALRGAGITRRPRQVIEFRDASWYDDRVYALLERHRIALCLHDMPSSATERVVVGPCVYVRFHVGTSRYGGRYDDRRLETWAAWLAGRVHDGLDVFAYFNNDTGGHAPRDAVRLRARIREQLPRPLAS